MSAVVVVGSPIHACKAYAALPYLRNLRKIREAAPDLEVEIVLADNTDDQGRFARDLQIIERTAVVLRPDWDRGSPLPIHERIRASSEAIRKHALERDAIGWLSIEADVLPPVDVIHRLITYAHEHSLEAVQGAYYQGFTAARFAQSSFWLMGLSFIRKSVLNDVPFRLELQRPNGYPDAFYGHDLVTKGVRFGFHPDIAAKHLEANRAGRGWDVVNADLARARRFTEWLLGEARDAG